MAKRRYELLLPLTFNDGRPVPSSAFERTREELLARFGAVTVQPGSALGTWAENGTRYEDDLLCFTFDADDTADNRRFVVDYKATLLARFDQKEVYIATYRVELI